MRRILGVARMAAVLALAAALTAPARADVLVSQASDFPADGFEFSQSDPTTNSFPAQVFDDVKLTTAGTATGLSWEGGYPNSTLPSQGGIQGFLIGFYADNAGVPGALLQSENIAGMAGESLVGQDNFGQFTYDYSTTLPTSFTLAAGKTYWISIAAVLPVGVQIWGWHTSVAGDLKAYSTTINGFVPNDVAFTLTGTAAVPEPSSLALAGVGGLAAVAFARRRRATR